MPTVKEINLKTLISQMTLDEKLAQVGSCWIYELQTEGRLDDEKISKRLINGLGQLTRAGGASVYPPDELARQINRLQKYLVEQTRLGIPALVHEECCCGAMLAGGTVFPQMLGLSATFQPELASAMTKAIRAQLRAVGAHQGLGPVLDVARDPRWGRVEETFGEDPVLISHFGAAYIEGLQGETLKNGILATGKHFIGHSFSQGGLNCGPVHIGWRELYEVFMLPFQAAIKHARLGSIMNAYPEVDGEVVAASRRILTDILRGELGFDGLVVSDYEAVAMIDTFHHVADDRAEAARLALAAGIDVELPSSDYYCDGLKTALAKGDINLEMLDLAVERHLRKKVELGLFDDPYVDEQHTLEVFSRPEDRQLAREIARQSMVLLKNDGSLPLRKTMGKLAVIGPNAHEARNLLGDYSYAAMKELLEYKQPLGSSFENNGASQTDLSQVITILDGIKEKVSAETQILYARGCDVNGQDCSGFKEALDAARQADVIILVLGDRSGLVPSCTTGETRDAASLCLPGVQEELARQVIAAGKPVVVVLVNGRPYAVSWLAEHASAILEAWLPGQEGGRSVADVLFGEVNPGGKLPITFPRGVGQVPIFYAAKPSGTGSFWYHDYVDEKAAPLYAFGHGLSYTTFAYSNLVINPISATLGDVVDISLQVQNSGEVAGDEVIQLYIRDVTACVPRPVKELKGFKRVTLQPGETRKITFHLPVNQLAYYDQALDLVIEPGQILVMVGSASDDIRLQADFTVTGAGKMAVNERVFTCPVDIA